MTFERMLCFVISLTLTQGVSADVWNNPYPALQQSKKIYYTSFTEQPKTLDPATSYSMNEAVFTGQIYEPPLRYDYYKRPYQLIPRTVTEMPKVAYFDAQGNEISIRHSDKIAKTVYTITIKPGIYYQPHPALAKDAQGNYRYLNLPADYLEDKDIYELSEFPHTGTRELVADDYIYQIKRLATPQISSPIYGLMSEHILGFDKFSEQFSASPQTNEWLDLRKYPLEGVKKISRYQYQITLKGQYQQFIYWLEMVFFAPIPWEADKFYSQEGMDDRNIKLSWYPIGTGPFMMTENNPNRQMVLTKNPNYREVYFPKSTDQEDIDKGYTRHAGKRLPLIDEAIFTLEKESMPRWNKFLQGYYDLSGITSDSYDQAIHVNPSGAISLSDGLKQKKMRLEVLDDPSIYYLGFNMLDPVVGGHSRRARLLRQAISIAINYEENIAIFLNGRGAAAQGIIPPGIFGHRHGREGLNPYVYKWANNQVTRRSIAEAKHLLRKAGYPNGIDPKTGRPLVLNYDVMSTTGPDDKSQLDWMRKQFSKLGIALHIRATQYNRFQEKLRSGNAQMFTWGWRADYPDPENFLFLMYGANGKVKHGGENATNYRNRRFDRLFEKMKNMPNSPERLQLIDEMMEILRYESPVAFGIYAQMLTISQQWLSASKPSTLGINTLQYMDIDIALRNKQRQTWNQPILWPMLFVGLLLLSLIFPVWVSYRRREHQTVKRVPSQ
jgi:ABC-type transport system substrate-binding protein